MNRFSPLTLLVVVCLAACASESPPPERLVVEAPVPGGQLRIPHEIPASLDPAMTDDAYEATIVNQVFDGLVQWDDDLNLQPDIAYSWVISPDGLHYEFKLRPNARFHNGRTVTAQDFVYSFTRLFNRTQVEPTIIQDYLDVVQGVDEYRDGSVDYILGFEALDDLTLSIRLARPYPSFMAVLCMDQAKVVPREEVERWGAEFGRHPVGTGPFRISTWDADRRLVLGRNPAYFGTAYLDSLVFVSYPSGDEDRIKEDFLAGRLEAREVRPDERAGLLRQKDFRIISRPELSLEFLGFNAKLPPFDRPEARRAVSLALNRTWMREVAGGGFDDPAGILPPGIPGYTPESKILPQDLDRARALVKSLGYGPGHPMPFVLYTASHSEHAQARDSSLVRSLERVYIVPDIRRVNWTELDSRITGQTAPSFFLTWIADLPDPDTFLFTLFESDGPYNIFAYHNVEVDSLLAAGRNERVAARRMESYRRAERLILEDAPMLPLFNFLTSIAFQPAVRGVEMSPFGMSSIPMEKIWITRGAREVVNAGL